jgi:hypothetical protein
MTILNVRHTTVYRYRRPVRLGDHRLMLRPRDSHDLRLIRTNLNFLPRASVRWIHDGSAIRSRLRRSPNRPPNCGSKASCSWKPIRWSGRDPRSLRRRRAIRSFYSADGRIDLGRMLERHHTDPASLDREGRMKVTRLLHARILIGCWRNVGSERRRHPESYPSET